MLGCYRNMPRDRITLFFLVLLLIISFSLNANTCPMSCTCKWKNGKQTVECINKDLLVIPEGMDSTTQVLEFCGNNLQSLHKDKFQKMDLINLQRIYLCRCRITTLDDRTFKGLTNLVELDLSGNLLEIVPSEAFNDCPSLMRLTLSHNRIKVLRKSAFGRLSFLTTLELSYCEIMRVEEGAFHGLYSLEWLHLNGNRMTTLQGNVYFPESLKGIQLQENLWECDCHILELHAWLQTFPIPNSLEPICHGPNRLKRRPINTVPIGELACLPDVSPTTFYLEIAEGRNVSLLCQVHAIPEASVSWKFQGQLLQNDSMIAPGVHLIYFIEEGAVEKRSELFIYNTNTDDNGTFICNAENAAGVAQSNFTIRIIVRHESFIEPNELPFEFILITMSAAAVSILLLLFLIIISIVKCHRSSMMRKKRNNSKAALSNSTKDNLLHDSVDEYSDTKETGSSIKYQEEETMLYQNSVTSEEIVASGGNVSNADTGTVTSPNSSLRNYQSMECNPDLINGTESVNRFHSLPQELIATASYPTPMKKRLYQQTIVERDMYVLAPDVRLNPVGLMGTTTAQQHFNCYKTLPYNRVNKRHQTAANPIGRYSREAEFLARSSQAAYEHYPTDVRYTADGYPARAGLTTGSADEQENQLVPPDSPVESHKSEPCCSSIKPSTWPGLMNSSRDDGEGNSNSNVRSVGAQTQTDEVGNGSGNRSVAKAANKSLSNLVKVQETLTESPDEGYEGETLNSCQN